MIGIGIEYQIRNQYKARRLRLHDAWRDGAVRTSKPLQQRERCCICLRPEHGGGLFIYQNRDGSERLFGHRCADYLDYLAAHPYRVQAFGVNSYVHPP